MQEQLIGNQILLIYTMKGQRNGKISLHPLLKLERCHIITHGTMT